MSEATNRTQGEITLLQKLVDALAALAEHPPGEGITYFDSLAGPLDQKGWMRRWFALNDAIAGAKALLAGREPPYYVRTFWSPDRRHLVTVHVSGCDDVNIIGMQDDNGHEWEPAGDQKDMTS